MELRQFISKTLFDIQAGVNDAIHLAKDGKVPGAINPVWGGAAKAGRDDVQTVTFDIAVQASETGSSEGGGGIKVMGVGIDGSLSSSTENTHTSRIQFTIPILLPVQSIVFEE